LALMTVNENKISCRVFGCNGMAVQSFKVKDTGWIHFECESGHQFHTDADLAKAELCSCELKAGPWENLN
jgi:hypothetical protein